VAIRVFYLVIRTQSYALLMLKAIRFHADNILQMDLRVGGVTAGKVSDYLKAYLQDDNCEWQQYVDIIVYHMTFYGTAFPGF